MTVEDLRRRLKDLPDDLIVKVTQPNETGPGDVLLDGEPVDWVSVYEGVCHIEHGGRVSSGWWRQR